MADVEEDAAFVRAALQGDINQLEAENEKLRATVLNIQSLAERGWPIDNDKLAERCRRVLNG